MANLKELPFSALQFYATAPYPCSYLDDRQARSQVATPAHLINADVYSELVKMGFRRSGIFTYRPYCDGCRACVPVRVPGRTSTSRTARSAASWLRHRRPRLARRHARRSTTSTTTSTCATSRPATPAAAWTTTAASSTRSSCCRARSTRGWWSSATPLPPGIDGLGTLRMVSIIDVLNDGLSSVYTFFDPDERGTSYGTFNILWQIEQCKALGLPYLYLGYWIAESPKMAYKARFRPVEMLRGGRWERLTEHKRAR